MLRIPLLTVVVAGLTLTLVGVTHAAEAKDQNIIDCALLAKLPDHIADTNDSRKMYAALFRRLSLDVVGTLPSVDEEKRFVTGTGIDRRLMVEDLLDLDRRPQPEQQRIRAALLENLLRMDQ